MSIKKRIEQANLEGDVAKMNETTDLEMESKKTKAIRLAKKFGKYVVVGVVVIGGVCYLVAKSKKGDSDCDVSELIDVALKDE